MGVPSHSVFSVKTRDLAESVFCCCGSEPGRITTFFRGHGKKKVKVFSRPGLWPVRRRILEKPTRISVGSPARRFREKALVGRLRQCEIGWWVDSRHVGSLCSPTIHKAKGTAWAAVPRGTGVRESTSGI